MRVIIKNQNSTLNNECVKWHLLDEKLWITQHKDYADIEKSIIKSLGSFNWLYEINDTVLFDKEEGRFRTAIIDLAGKICVGDLKGLNLSTDNKQKGDLFLLERKNCDFEFLPSIVYDKYIDSLYAFPNDLDKQDYVVLFIADDFGFVIIKDQLEGWILKNASKHIWVGQENQADIDRNLLAKYLNALKLWEEGDFTELESLFQDIEVRKDSFSIVIKSCLRNML